LRSRDPASRRTLLAAPVSFAKYVRSLRNSKATVATVDGFQTSQLNSVSKYVAAHGKSSWVLLKSTGGTFTLLPGC